MRREVEPIVKPSKKIKDGKHGSEGGQHQRPLKWIFKISDGAFEGVSWQPVGLIPSAWIVIWTLTWVTKVLPEITL